MVKRLCDRCKQMYPLILTDTTPETTGYGVFNAVATIDIVDCVKNSTRQHTYWLCPQCRDDFNKWFLMKGEK